MRQDSATTTSFIGTLLYLIVGLGSSEIAIAQSKVQIHGAGATFPLPLYSKWFSEYQKVDPTVQINYQSIGSGGGIRQLLEKTIDFGASDIFMTQEQLSKASQPILHIPTAIGAIVVAYHLPGVPNGLQIDSQTLANIYLGKIQKWNHPSLIALNPKISLPDTPIIVIRRSDGSGTTDVFSDFLSKISSEWKEKVGTGTAIKWPVGLGGKGNEGVSGLIKQTPGSIGYTELAYAESTKLTYAALQNKSGKFILPSEKSVTSAASAVVSKIPEDFRISITSPEGEDSYPLSSFTYILIYQTMPHEKGTKFVEFLNWAIHNGQKEALKLSYAPLPTSLVKKIEKKLKSVAFK